MIPPAVVDFPNPLDCNPSLGFANLGKCLSGITKGVASDAFSSIASAFAKAADSTINWLWAQMSTATAIHLGGAAFNQLFDVALAVAVVLAVGIFVAEMAISALRRDPSGISRAAVGLVVMGIGGGVAVATTDLLLQAVDAVSVGVLQMTTGDTVAQMGNSLIASGAISSSTTNPAGLLLISLFALVAVVVVWLALTVRKLLVVVAAVLAPFAFAGSLADFSRSWVRRWAEVVVALVFSKLILMFVFVTGLFVLIRGVGSTGAGATQGITQTVSGILILGLAGFAPWVAIKMAHFAGHHLEGMHAMAAGATAGATAVQSMARPVGTAMLPAAGLAGVAAGVGSSAKPWSPQTPGSSSGDTSAATEPVTPPGDSPSAGAAMASKGGGNQPLPTGRARVRRPRVALPQRQRTATDRHRMGGTGRTRPGVPHPSRPPSVNRTLGSPARLPGTHRRCGFPRSRRHRRYHQPASRKETPEMSILSVSITPNATGLPGLSELSTIVGAMLTVGAILCVLGVILSSVVWATASTSGNVQLVSRCQDRHRGVRHRRSAHRWVVATDHIFRERRQRALMGKENGRDDRVLPVADKPLCIDVLLALQDGRDWRAIELVPEPDGLMVDWAVLLESYLSSTEKPTVFLVDAVGRVEGNSLPRRVPAGVEALLKDLTSRREEEVSTGTCSNSRGRCSPLASLAWPARRGVRVWAFAWVRGDHRREPGPVVLMGRSKTCLALVGGACILAGGAVPAIRLGSAL